MKVRQTILALGLVAATSACEEIPPLCHSVLLDACKRAEELAHHVGTQVGDASAIGIPTPGQAASLGATGKLSVGLRSSFTRRDLPQLGDVPVRTDGTVGRAAFSSTTSTVSAISADIVVGAHRGLRFGEVRTGAIDLMGSLTAMPSRDGSGLHVTSGARLGVGIGARMELLGETSVLPAVSVSLMKRALPTLAVSSQYLATTSNPADAISVELRKLDVVTYGYRFAASKRIGPLGLSIGHGRDDYDISSQYTVTSTNPEVESATDYTSSSLSRDVLFAGASIPLGAPTLSVEVGRLYGGRIPQMMNQFGDRPANARRTFVTLGMRIPAGRTHDRVRQ